MNVNFRLTGISSLLMHADDIEQADLLKEWRSDPDNKSLSVSGDDRSPGWTWMTYLYSDGTNVIWPVANLMVCLRQAGAQIILKRQTTFKQASQSGLIPTDEYIDFRCGGKKVAIADVLALRDLPFGEQCVKVRDLGFRLWAKRAAIGAKKHVRVRPRFDSWSMSGSLEVVLPEITPAVLESMFSIAGRVGLGDWRPGCKTPGPFGRFTAKLATA